MAFRGSRNRNASIGRRTIPRDAARKLLLSLDGESFLGQQFGVSITGSENISQRFGVIVVLVDDSFEFVNGWPDTIPDALINPSLDFSTAESSLSDSFETVDSWP